MLNTTYIFIIHKHLQYFHNIFIIYVNYYIYINIFNFLFSYEFSRVIKYGLLEVGHKNDLNNEVKKVVLLPIGCNRLFHKLFAP